MKGSSNTTANIYDKTGKIRVSLTQFVDFTLARDTEAKLVKGAEIRQQLEHGYHPNRDFYLPARRLIISSSGGAVSVEDINNIETQYVKRQPLLRNILEGYNRVVSKTSYESVSLDSIVWEFGDLRIPITPELSLSDGEIKTIYKLYFKEVKPDSRDASKIYQLLFETLLPDEKVAVGLIDLRRGVVVPKPKKVPDPRTHEALEWDARMLEEILKNPPKV